MGDDEIYIGDVFEWPFLGIYIVVKVENRNSLMSWARLVTYYDVDDEKLRTDHFVKSDLTKRISSLVKPTRYGSLYDERR